MPRGYLPTAGWPSALADCSSGEPRLWALSLLGRVPGGGVAGRDASPPVAGRKAEQSIACQ